VPTKSSAALLAQRTIRTKHEAEYIKLRTAILRGEHVHHKALERGLQQICPEVERIILASKLTAAEKNEILQNIRQIPITIDQIRRDQSKAVLAVEATGNGASSDADEDGPKKVSAKKARRTGTKAEIEP
jgi:hypothetical protein